MICPMEAHEFGKENSRKIVLIPGNMMCWKQFKNEIPLPEKDYHVIAVSTDGYDGTGEIMAHPELMANEMRRFLTAELYGGKSET